MLPYKMSSRPQGPLLYTKSDNGFFVSLTFKWEICPRSQQNQMTDL